MSVRETNRASIEITEQSAKYTNLFARETGASDSADGRQFTDEQYAPIQTETDKPINNPLYPAAKPQKPAKIRHATAGKMRRKTKSRLPFDAGQPATLQSIRR